MTRRSAPVRAAPGSPAALGYRMPAEWEPHRATWLVWPHAQSDWPGKFPVIPWVFSEIVRWAQRSEQVEVVVQDRWAQRRARLTLERSHVPLDNVRFHPWRTDRCWTRDSGPTFVRLDRPIPRRPRIGAVHWKFNGWAKYDNWANDRELPVRIAHHLRVPVWRAMAHQRWAVLEGGAIDVNGRGALLATVECLLGSTQRRNPGWTPSDLQQLFADDLGVEEVIWLPGGIAGDDTHGHVDDVARFVGPRTVVAVAPRDGRDPNARILRRNLAVLRAHRDAHHRPLTVIELPSPEPIRFRGEVLPASYANFYITNRAALVPTFNDAADEAALRTLRRCFPGRTVVGIGSRDLIWGLGAIHCVTQQEPETTNRTPAAPRSAG